MNRRSYFTTGHVALAALALTVACHHATPASGAARSSKSKSLTNAVVAYVRASDTGRPVVGAMGSLVVRSSAKGDTVVSSASADGGGNLELGPVPDGSYTLSIRMLGYDSRATSVTLPKESGDTVRIWLKRNNKGPVSDCLPSADTYGRVGLGKQFCTPGTAPSVAR